MSRRAWSFSRRQRMMADLDQDIRDYIERETQDNIERGMPPEEARYAALRKFGNVTRVKAGWRRPLAFEVCEFAKRRSWGMADAQ